MKSLVKISATKTLTHKISRKEISERLGIAESAIQKHIKALTNLKVLRRVGTRNGYWIIEK